MKMRRSCQVGIVLGVLIIFPLISDAWGATLTGLTVTPANPTLNVGQTQPFTVTGSYSDGSTRALNPAGALATGYGHTCAVLANGTVACWGLNGNGQLGNGTITDASAPVPVSGISTATAIAAGAYHTCALLANGTVACWGSNGNGQLGNGTTTDASAPVPVSGISTATAIASGFFHTCALLTDGTVACWGYNYYGQLGNGTTTDASAPVTVSGISTATAIAVGGFHTCAPLTDGTVACWGLNGNGQLGDGTTTDASAPVPVSGITTATAIASGAYHNCAVLADAVACWGLNGNGQLGDGTTTDASAPVPVTGITTATAIAAGGFHACAVQANGTVACWGRNGNGQLGNGTTTDASAPVPVTGISTATAIAAGFFHTCAVQANGTVACWGYNFYGQLGNGTTTDASAPVPVSGISTALTVVWTNSNPTVATLTATGMASAQTDGTSTITAISGAVSGSTLLTVGAPTFTLTLSTAGSGSGTVSGEGTYDSGQTAAVSQSANTGSAFTGWTGPDAAECTTGSVLMNANKSCTANFALNTYGLTLDTAGTGSGTTSGAGLFSYNHIAIVSATASAGSAFTGWTGPDAAECTTGTVKMNADKHCTANFTLMTSTQSDLIVSAMSTATTVLFPGKIFVLLTTVKNQGSGTAKISITAFHLSKDATYGGSDDIVFPMIRPVLWLGPGAHRTVFTILFVPIKTPLGAYYLCAMADSHNAIVESDETNNTACTGSPVQVAHADLGEDHGHDHPPHFDHHTPEQPTSRCEDGFDQCRDRDK
jgi:alpha-tubulin suppressor-like RCC1 family protein